METHWRPVTFHVNIWEVSPELSCLKFCTWHGGVNAKLLCILTNRNAVWDVRWLEGPDRDTLSTLLAYYGGNHRSPVYGIPIKNGQQCAALPLLFVWISCWTNNSDADDWRRSDMDSTYILHIEFLVTRILTLNPKEYSWGLLGPGRCIASNREANTSRLPKLHVFLKKIVFPIFSDRDYLSLGHGQVITRLFGRDATCFGPGQLLNILKLYILTGLLSGSCWRPTVVHY